MSLRARQRGPRRRSRTVVTERVSNALSKQYYAKEAAARRTFPQATLALSEYSEMAIFSSTMWSAKLSGLAENQKHQYLPSSQGSKRKTDP
jgi:hypothetical protein